MEETKKKKGGKTIAKLAHQLGIPQKKGEKNKKTGKEWSKCRGRPTGGEYKGGPNASITETMEPTQEAKKKEPGKDETSHPDQWAK